MADAEINQIAFNPVKEIIAVGTELGIQMWRLGTKDEEALCFNMKVEMKRKEARLIEQEDKIPKIKYHQCTSITWDACGKYLFAGFTDGLIRVYELNAAEK